MGDYGGFTKAAQMLTEKLPRADGRPCSRQQVYTWWRRRHINGFPGQHERTFPCPQHKAADCDRCDGSGHIKRRLLLLEDVLSWAQTYKPSSGGRPRGKEQE
jgi:hypothetical protein